MKPLLCCALGLRLFMNGKRFIMPILALCLVASFSGPCSGEDPKNTLTVKRIEFTSDKVGGEWISLLCNQSCTPELSILEGENPRVVMDMKEVLHIQTRIRSINTRGKLVKRIRNYLDKETNRLRVVLDLDPSKSYVVRPRQDAPKNSYMITIYEGASLSKQKPGGSGTVKDSPPSQDKRITIFRPDLRPGEQKGTLQEAAPSAEKHSTVEATQETVQIPENRNVVEAAKDKVTIQEERGAMEATRSVPSFDQGRSHITPSEFATAVDTFTQVIAAHPQDSLSYRMRGNAYDNLGDHQKAIDDWTKAARLGDPIMQFYLDFLGVKWREK